MVIPYVLFLGLVALGFILVNAVVETC